MRTLEINKQPMWYALCTGKTEIVDDYGNNTGCFQVTYGTPVYYPVNMSEARGTIKAEAYGLTDDYDRTFVTTDMACPITTDTVIWYDADPLTEPYNYVVHRVAKSLNSITIAIRGVDVTKEPVVSA